MKLYQKFIIVLDFFFFRLLERHIFIQTAVSNVFTLEQSYVLKLLESHSG